MNFEDHEKYLLDLIIFTQVATKRSFTKVADALNISKSVISKRISRLEKLVGVQLLHRTTRQLILTEIGQAFYEKCLQIKAGIEEADSFIASEQEDIKGVIKINTPLSFSHLYLVQALCDFTKKHSNVHFEMLPGSAYKNFFDNNLDLAIRVGEQNNSTFRARKIMESCMVACASPKYIKKHGKPKHPNDLYNHNCLLYYDSPTGLLWRFHEDGKVIDLKVQGSLMASTSETLTAAALHDLGIVLLPKYLLEKQIAEKSLIPFLEDFLPEKINIYVLYPPTQYIPLKTRLFIDFLAKRFM